MTCNTTDAVLKFLELCYSLYTAVCVVYGGALKFLKGVISMKT